MILVLLEHLGVVVRVELDGKHIGDAGVPQALLPPKYSEPKMRR